MKDTFSMPYPPSVNGYWQPLCFGKRASLSLTKKGKDYRLLAAKHLMMQRVCRGKTTDRLKVIIEVFPPDRRKRDLDNILKGLLDAITKYEIWGDDSQVDDLRVVRKPIVKGGNIVVTINSIKP